MVVHICTWFSAGLFSFVPVQECRPNTFWIVLCWQFSAWDWFLRLGSLFLYSIFLLNKNEYLDLSENTFFITCRKYHHICRERIIFPNHNNLAHPQILPIHLHQFSLAIKRRHHLHIFLPIRFVVLVVFITVLHHRNNEDHAERRVHRWEVIGDGKHIQHL